MGRNNAILIDGLSHDDAIPGAMRGMVSLDAVKEFVVSTNGVAAEYGQASGAVVNVVTRSGTNTVSARGFYYHRDDAWDATPGSAKLAVPQVDKTRLNQNIYGGSAGGPMVRNRAFFFGSLEHYQRDTDAGGIPRPLVSSDLSGESFDLTWSLATPILFQQPGNQNYYELDPETGRERLLLGSPVGWIFSPVHSLDGQKIAVAWTRKNRGVWIIDVKNRRETPVYTSVESVTPVGWSPDGRSIYVVEGKNSTYRGLAAPLGETMTDAKILMVPVNGGAVRKVADLPFEEIGSVAMAPDGRRFIATVHSSRSDVWVVDNFNGSPEPGVPRESFIARLKDQLARIRP